MVYGRFGLSLLLCVAASTGWAIQNSMLCDEPPLWGMCVRRQKAMEHGWVVPVLLSVMQSMKRGKLSQQQHRLLQQWPCSLHATALTACSKRQALNRPKWRQPSHVTSPEDDIVLLLSCRWLRVLARLSSSSRLQARQRCSVRGIMLQAAQPR